MPVTGKVLGIQTDSLSWEATPPALCAPDPGSTPSNGMVPVPRIPPCPLPCELLFTV